MSAYVARAMTMPIEAEEAHEKERRGEKREKARNNNTELCVVLVI